MVDSDDVLINVLSNQIQMVVIGYIYRVSRLKIHMSWDSCRVWRMVAR